MPDDSALIRSISSNEVSLKDWIHVQEKTFIRWINMKLQTCSHPPIESLKDLSDGLQLFNLLDCLKPELSVKPVYSKPLLKIQKLENLNKFLDILKNYENLHIYNIGSEDICDSNEKLILGLIWALILNYTSITKEADDEDSLNMKELLLKWCQKVLLNYDNIRIKNFTNSWSNGLALCAMMDYFQPELINYSQINPDKVDENIELVLRKAESIGITKLIDVEDLNCSKPDEKSIIAYLTLWYDKFHTMNIYKKKHERNVGHLRIRVESFIKIISEIMEYKNSYLTGIEKLTKIIYEEVDKLAIDKNIKINKLNEIMAYSKLLNGYRSGLKYTIYKKFNELKLLKNRLDLMMLEFNFDELEESETSSISRITSLIKDLNCLENDLSLFVTNFINNKKQELLNKFKRISSDVDLGLSLIEVELIELPKSSKYQLNELPEILEDLKSLENLYLALKKIKSELDLFYNLYEDNNANSISNLEQYDQTFKMNELKYKIKLIKDVIIDKLRFIDLQFSKKSSLLKTLKSTIVNDEKLSDLQVYQFELIFDKFDKGFKKYLNKTEFKEALNFVYPSLTDAQMNEFFEVIYENDKEILRGVRFDSFIKILKILSRNEDEEDYDKKEEFGSNISANDEQLITLTSDFYLNTFKEVSNGKNFITIDDLSNIKLSKDMIEKLGGILEEEEFENGNEDNKGNKSFNYLKFFEHNEDSVLFQELQPSERGLEDVYGLENILDDLDESDMDAKIYI